MAKFLLWLGASTPVLLSVARKASSGGIQRGKSRCVQGCECKIPAEVAPEFERPRGGCVISGSVAGTGPASISRCAGDWAWGRGVFLGGGIVVAPPGSLVCSNRMN